MCWGRKLKQQPIKPPSSHGSLVSVNVFKDPPNDIQLEYEKIQLEREKMAFENQKMREQHAH